MVLVVVVVAAAATTVAAMVGGVVAVICCGCCGGAMCVLGAGGQGWGGLGGARNLRGRVEQRRVPCGDVIYIYIYI